jgi:hypothetical protein
MVGDRIKTSHQPGAVALPSRHTIMVPPYRKWIHDILSIESELKREGVGRAVRKFSSPPSFHRKTEQQNKEYENVPTPPFQKKGSSHSRGRTASFDFFFHEGPYRRQNL